MKTMSYTTWGFHYTDYCHISPVKKRGKTHSDYFKTQLLNIYIVCMIGKSYIGISMTQAEKYFIFLYYRNNLSKT